MKSDDEWVNLVKGILRAEMTRRAITYDQLAARLAELGVKDTAVYIRNKVARGGFSAVFFVQCLRAIGCQEVRLSYGPEGRLPGAAYLKIEAYLVSVSFA
jgi:Domain of unknown function (DUF6471)